MRKKQFWGITLVLIALTLIASAFNIFDSKNIIAILWSIVLVTYAISALIRRNLITGFVALAIALTINASNLNIKVVPGYIIPSAALLGLGLGMLLPKKKKSRRVTINYDGKDVFNSKNEFSDDSNHIFIENNFGESIRYLNSTNLTNVTIENNLGSCIVYFDQAQFNPAGCDVFVENNLGKTTLYFPKEINIQSNLMTTLGTVTGDKSFFTDSSAPNITLNGDCNLGEIEIKFF